MKYSAEISRNFNEMKKTKHYSIGKEQLQYMVPSKYAPRCFFHEFIQGNKNAVLL